MKHRQVTYYVPDFLVEAFTAEVNKMEEELGKPYGARGKIITEALAAMLNVELPDSHTTKIKTVHNMKVKAEPEALAYEMEPGVSYTITDAMNLTGLSRTTVRRLFYDNPQFFQDVDPESYVKAFELVDRKPRVRKVRRKKRKNRQEYKPNTLMEKTRKAREGLEIELRDEDDFDDYKNPIVRIASIVKMENGEERELGFHSLDQMMLAQDLRDDKLITNEEMETYMLQYYYEEPKDWVDSYPTEKDKKILKRRLKNVDEVVPKVEALLEVYEQ